MLKLCQDQGTSFLFFKGEASTYPVEFRLVSRVLGVFLLSKMKAKNTLLVDTTQPTIEGDLLKEIFNLKQCKTNVEYSNFIPAIQHFVDFISQPKKLFDIEELAFIVTSTVYFNDPKKRNSFVVFSK